VWREADLTGVFAVDDRGVVTLPLVGEYRVEGLSYSELRIALLDSYRQYLQNPSIEVTVLRRISILGEVRSPGVYQVDATVSLFGALALAGGITQNGNPDKIQLIRGEATVVENVPPSSVIGSTEIRSGDQLVVGQRGWVARNTGAIAGSLIAATAIVAAAVISN
jgi:polysaccharide export outer membrane protein